MTTGERAVRLRLHGDPLAMVVERGSGDRTAFDLHFEPAWIDQVQRPVFSLGAFSWRLATPRRFPGRLPAFLTNLLPERHGALRRRIARAAALDEHDELALLGFVGQSLSGALSVEAVEAPNPAPRVVEHPAPPAVEVERLRWSLGGMQLKFSVDRTDRITLPVDGRQGRWILKIPEASRPGLARAELAVMEWARAAGFQVPELAIVDPREVEGVPPDAVENIAEALLVRRFDRLEDYKPVHMEELTSVFRAHPEEKYSDVVSDVHHANHLVAVGRVVKRFSGDDGLRTFLARVIFDVLAGNGDAHLKNWAFVFPDRRTPTLAPVYDVVPTILFGLPPRLALQFAGGTPFAAIDHARISQFAVKVGATAEDLLKVARETVERAADTFSASMVNSGLPHDQISTLRAHWESLPLVRQRVG